MQVNNPISLYLNTSFFSISNLTVSWFWWAAVLRLIASEWVKVNGKGWVSSIRNVLDFGIFSYIAHNKRSWRLGPKSEHEIHLFHTPYAHSLWVILTYLVYLQMSLACFGVLKNSLVGKHQGATLCLLLRLQILLWAIIPNWWESFQCPILLGTIWVWSLHAAPAAAIWRGKRREVEGVINMVMTKGVCRGGG